MPNPILGHWRRNALGVRKFRRALRELCDALAPTEPSRTSLARALDDEPRPAAEPSAVDPALVNLKLLESALEDFWGAYWRLPAPPGSDDRAKYRLLPEPLPRHHRVTLDQCFRVLLARFGWFDPWPLRFVVLLQGVSAPPPGMEDVIERYVTVAPPEVSAAIARIHARRSKEGL